MEVQSKEMSKVAKENKSLKASFDAKDQNIAALLDKVKQKKKALKEAKTQHK